MTVTDSLSQTQPIPSTAKVPVSVVIPAKNEAANLPRCLDHLRWADEVVIVDSLSQDATRQIADAYGVRVIDFDWNGQWPKKRNWTLRQADLKHEWIFFVDADEWVVPELAEEVGRVIRNPDCIGYYVNRRFIFMGRWLKHCGYYPSWNLRLIKRGHGEYERMTTMGDTGSGDNEVHEHLIPDGEVGYLKHDLLHFAFPDIATFVEKHNRYSSWEAAVEVAGEGAHPLHAHNRTLERRRRLKTLSRKLGPLRPWARFCYSYFFRLGFLDGLQGLVFCRLLAMYEFLSYAKKQELSRHKADLASGQSLSQVPAFDIAL